MLREELNEKDTWDLTTIFANNEEFEKAFNNANIEIENITTIVYISRCSVE